MDLCQKIGVEKIGDLRRFVPIFFPWMLSYNFFGGVICNITIFFVISEVLIVIVQNNNIRAVATRLNVGPITIQFNPIISEIELNLNLR